MEIEATSALERAEQRAWRATALSVIAPLTVLAGVVWAIAQPYRLTLLDPAAHGVWDLLHNHRHPVLGTREVPRWYPPACLVYDFPLAIFVAVVPG